MITDTLNYEFLALKSCTYLNTPATGLVSKEAREEQQNYLRNFDRQGSTYIDELEYPFKSDLKNKIATYFGCHFGQIGLVPSFSAGINYLLSGLYSLESVAYLKTDYPSLTLPLSLGTYNSIEIAPNEDGFYSEEKIITQCVETGVRFLFLSHVQYNSGQKLDIEFIGAKLKAHEIFIIVDSTQSAGNSDFNFSKSNISCAIMSCYKWLNAGFGSGIILAKESFLSALDIKTGGFTAVLWKENSNTVDRGLAQLQPGHVAPFALTGLSSALDMHLKLKESNAHLIGKNLLSQFFESFPQIENIVGNPDNDSYANFCCIRDKERKLSGKLTNKNIVHTYRNGVVRLGFHFYNTEEDVEILINAISS
ncbi:aminotransferase class V-fold PLP-dependent enzyme [Luteibaculum oceani]|uniref:Aminotransferase class V-fold PLP-dependent enzyme n=1 Tax=Luteibaculum oceani TaxID=1294296 RepID=A0A5C6VC36_9FLAO|nr:aminotransferase class V-fold PLP-dependent enzyme [Luteibaculum oceani]TXC82136.1 aminotransferase class V-fold PLP-dependent enzyme [Luteibaculum oceani]